MATTPRSQAPKIGGGDAIEVEKESEARSRLQLLPSHLSCPNGLNQRGYALG